MTTPHSSSPMSPTLHIGNEDDAQQIPDYTESNFTDFLNDHDEDYTVENNVIEASDHKYGSYDSFATDMSDSVEISNETEDKLVAIKARNSALITINYITTPHSSSPMSPTLPIGNEDDAQQISDYTESNFTDFLNDHDEDYTVENNVIEASDHKYVSYDSFATDKSDSVEISNETEVGNETILEPVDFQFVDEIGSSIEYSAFEIAEEISRPMVQEEEPVMLSEAMKRMNNERKFSACLYAFNGINECLKLSSSRLDRSDQLTRLMNACQMNREETTNNNNNNDNSNNDETAREDESAGVGSNFDGESMLWSSIDLPTICYVN
ncbi:hypothetical protein SASPL_139882 [Salvia splendens]|uniref:Uncharacterized protein n=2 Tax=Salvia splendens TaxID=180675 RepID=A0A8X8WNZ8_SALSN|nr:hypothetical protein SASPL_139882 [Salvia splendens]